MTDDYLTTVLEEAEHVAKQHDQVACTTDNQAQEYLRYAVLRMLEGEADHLPADWTPIDGVTVGYGRLFVGHIQALSAPCDMIYGVNYRVNSA